jgi:hypothetical protein
MENLVREKNLEEVKQKINSMVSDFVKISYIESALTHNFTFDVKRYLYTTMADLCERKKMFDRAAKAIVNRTTIEVTFRERIASFLRAGELYAKEGRVEDSVQTFMKAYAEANSQQKTEIKQKMMDTLRACAAETEKTGRKQAVITYYEKLLELPIGEIERRQIKEKLIVIYKSLGKFTEVKSLEMGLRGARLG